MSRRPPLALSLGDPAGIGPEIICAAWQALRTSGPVFVVTGDADLLATASSAPVRRIDSMDAGPGVFPDAIPVLHSPVDAAVIPGRGDPAHAAAVVRWIETGVALCRSGEAAGLVTAPIAKAPLYAAGFGFPGHTEFLADLTADMPMPGVTSGRTPSPARGRRGPVMMLTARDLRVSLVTIHTPLAAVPAALTTEAIVRVGEVTAQALQRDFGIVRPRLAMAGLNPHAGESGTIGREEIEIINPAAAELRSMGIDCSDARPADSLFHAEARAGFDAVIGQYHDQALIPVKTIDFWGGVNVSLGLPIVRTSPDHGVGYDIAGRGLARPDSLIAALRLAGETAARRLAAATTA
jgi:4-hydroxythreonine-4-phosphate dehydrogenase